MLDKDLQQLWFKMKKVEGYPVAENWKKKLYLIFIIYTQRRPGKKTNQGDSPHCLRIMNSFA